MKRQAVDAPGGLVDPDAPNAAAVEATDAVDYDSLLYDPASTGGLDDDDGLPIVSEDTASMTALGGVRGFEADNIPPEILQNPAVQAAISHAAAEYEMTAGAASTPAESPIAKTREAAVATPTGQTRPTDDEDEEEMIEEDLSSTSSRTRGFAASRPSSTSSVLQEEGEQGEESFGMRLSSKFGWTALAAMTAGYFISLI